MSCAQGICSLDGAGWYLDLTGWHLPAFIAALVTTVAVLVVWTVARRARRWERPPIPVRTDSDIDVDEGAFEGSSRKRWQR